VNPQQTIRLAVIDDDSGFVTVLAKRAEAAGWQLRTAADRPDRPRRRSLELPRAGQRDAA
jgi:hypothetical protein